MSTTITDVHGRTFNVSADSSTYSAADGSLSAAFPDSTPIDSILNTLNAMAPTPPSAPPVPVPQQITRWQAYQQMSATASFVHAAPATLFADVQALAQASGGAILMAWQNQSFMLRHGPFIAGLMAPLGLTDAILDSLFIAAAQLPA